MTSVGFKQADGIGRILLRTSAPVRYSVGEDGRRNVVVTLENTEIGLPNNERMLDTSFFDTAVSLVKPEAVDDTQVRITISLKRAVAYRTTQAGNELTVEFERPD
jgi:colicin import membrane protein